MIAKFILGGHTILSDTSTSTLDDLDDNIQVDVQVPGTFYSWQGDNVRTDDHPAPFSNGDMKWGRVHGATPCSDKFFGYTEVPSSTPP